jgi:hypothetical protein
MIIITIEQEQDSDLLFLIKELARRVRNEVDTYPQTWLSKRYEHYDD